MTFLSAPFEPIDNTSAVDKRLQASRAETERLQSQLAETQALAQLKQQLTDQLHQKTAAFTNLVQLAATTLVASKTELQRTFPEPELGEVLQAREAARRQEKERNRQARKQKEEAETRVQELKEQGIVPADYSYGSEGE